MKVLITGGYGFIGSHVAKQFHKEGYEIFIIDNLSTGKRENVTVKHKSYILSVEDEKCNDIFASYNFDIVVHLAAQASVAKSVIYPKDDAKSNILGLINILQLATEHHVKKFIFASTAAIYGNNSNIPLKETYTPQPISPYGLSKWTGEQYCLNWNAENDIDVICFRFSNVYGPRQTSEGEGGVISTFISRLIKDEPLQIHGDGNQTRDFIYVSDVAFAIYRASQSIMSGVYNLSTNTQATINDIVRNLEKIHGSVQTINGMPRPQDIYHSRLCNERVKKELDWTPMYDLKEGLQKTYNWATSAVSTPVEQKKEKRELPIWFKGWKPYFENFIIFCLLYIIVLKIPMTIFPTFEIGIFYIMTIGAIYGNKQAFLAVILSFLLLLTDNIRQGREFISLMYDTTFFFQLATFLFIGLVVGYSVQRKNNTITDQKETIEELQKRYQFLREIHQDVRAVKDELQMRVLTSEDSFGKIHSIIKQLDYLEPEKVLTSTVNIVQKIMKCNSVSIYMFNKYQSYLRLVANSNTSENRTLINSIKVDETPYVQQMIHTGKHFINKSLLHDAPLMAAPIYHNQQIIAIISIDELPFDSFSNYHQNLFKVVIELIETSLGRAFDYIQVTEDSRYIEQTTVLKPEIFKKIVNSKIEAKEKYNIPFALLTMPVPQSQLSITADKVGQLLRETDYISFENEEMYILLSNTKQEDISYVLKRFEDAGITLELYEGVVG